MSRVFGGTMVRRLVGVVVLIALVAGVGGTAAIATNALGAGDRFESLVARVDRFFNPPPDRPIDDEQVRGRPTPTPTPVPSFELRPSPSGSVTASPRTATPELARASVDVDILKRSNVDPATVFASQVEKDMCAPAGVQMTLAVLRLADTSAETQLGIHRRVREWESWRDSHNGEWGPTAIANALAAYGASGYKVRVYETRADAMFHAALAIEMTGKPVVLVPWRGAHTWVMTGYRADADPTLFADARVSGAYILDPWFPRVSSIWGPSDPPGTFQDAAEMKRNYLPWKRPEGLYDGRDGKFVAVVPTE